MGRKGACGQAGALTRVRGAHPPSPTNCVGEGVHPGLCWDAEIGGGTGARRRHPSGAAEAAATTAESPANCAGLHLRNCARMHSPERGTSGRRGPTSRVHSRDFNSIAAARRAPQLQGICHRTDAGIRLERLKPPQRPRKARKLRGASPAELRLRALTPTGHERSAVARPPPRCTLLAGSIHPLPRSSWERVGELCEPV